MFGQRTIHIIHYKWTETDYRMDANMEADWENKCHNDMAYSPFFICNENIYNHVDGGKYYLWHVVAPF